MRINYVKYAKTAQLSANQNFWTHQNQIHVKKIDKWRMQETFMNDVLRGLYFQLHSFLILDITILALIGPSLSVSTIPANRKWKVTLQPLES